jgi:hypothetical protein
MMGRTISKNRNKEIFDDNDYQSNRAPGKIVKVKVSGDGPIESIHYLRNGETREFSAFDNVSVKVREICEANYAAALLSGGSPPPPPGTGG